MSPRLGGPMVSFDATEALKIKDVLDVVDMTGPDSEPFGGGFAVLATNTWAAFMGAQAVIAEWGAAPYPTTTAEMDAVLSDTLAKGNGDNLRDDGDVGLAFADAPRDRIVDVEYSVPYLAHATMEPMNATAQLRDGRLDIWAGTQMPTIVRADCAVEAGVEVTDTYVHSTYLGGGFGRRGEVDFTRFATRLAKSTNGKPVKLVWSREEDMTHDTYRPAAKSRWRARLGDDGVPVAIDATIACPSVIGSVMGRMYPSLPMAGPDNTITHGAFDQPYTVADYRVSGIKAPLDVPIGFWRSVGNSYNGFFHESFIDECALAADMDPLEMRLKLMKDHPTAQNALRRVAEMADWKDQSTNSNRAKGIAFTLSFGCWTAQVVEVSRNALGAISIDKVWCAADVGHALDPDICKAQLMSAIVFGLSSCVGQEITFADGMVEQTNFDDFDALRMTNCPAIEIELLEEAEHMAGIGEPGTPPSIPALANAIARLTGERIRTMPLSKSVTFA
ncbi:molybdopterin-dependent oxidoreductase, partial [Rhizobiaceae bacterium]|nr:molybdopterin-dependent oxidoreductase [Rhizobiaceae bacterium]